MWVRLTYGHTQADDALSTGLQASSVKLPCFRRPVPLPLSREPQLYVTLQLLRGNWLLWSTVVQGVNRATERMS